MRRFVVLGLVVPFVLLPVDTAASAVATCQGEEATIVGEPNGTVNGTDGDDVIVSNGAAHIFGNAGADLVCLTGLDVPNGVPDVDAGAGNDSLVVESADYRRVRVVLGEGDDSFIGGSRPDWVLTHDPENPPEDFGTDQIDTGGSDDWVRIGDVSGEWVFDGQVDTGEGDDRISLLGSGTDGSGHLDGGPGRNTLDFSSSADESELRIGAGTGIAVRDDLQFASWEGVTDFSVSWRGEVTFVGTSRAEFLGISGDVVPDVFMRAGRDLVSVLGRQAPGSIGLGEGRDALYLDHSLGKRLDVDLPEGEVTYAPSRVLDVAGVEDVEAHSKAVAITGDGHDNRLYAGCGAILRGSGGGDVLAYRPDGPGCRAGMGLYGGSGDDRMVGTPRGDELFGAGGHDRGDGRRGADRCVGVERRVACERR